MPTLTELKVRLSWDSSEVKAGLKQTRYDLKKFSTDSGKDAVDESRKAAGEAKKAAEASGQASVKSLKSTVEAAKTAVAATISEAKRAAETTVSVANAEAIAVVAAKEREASAAKKASDDTVTATKRGAQEATAAALKSVEAAEKAIGKLDVAQKRVGDAMRDRARSTGMALTLGITAPIALLTKRAVDLAGSFETSMNVLQYASKASKTEMAAMADEARKLGADTKLPATSAVDAAVAMTELAKAGISVKDTMAATRGTLQLAAAAHISAGEAAKIEAAALGAFNLQGTQAARVANLLAASANESQGEITDTAQAMQQAAAVYSVAKIPIEDLTTQITLMARAGIIGSDAGTSLKTMLQRLTPTSKAAIDQFGKLGIAVYDAHGKMLPMREIVRQFSSATSKMTDAQRANTNEVIFGQDAYRAAAVVLEGGVAKYDAITKAVEDKSAAEDAATARTKGYQGAIQAFNSSLDTTLQLIAEPALNAGAGFFRSLSDGLEALNNASPALRNTVVGVALVAAATGPLILGLGAIAGAVRNLIELRGLFVAAQVAKAGAIATTAAASTAAATAETAQAAATTAVTTTATTATAAETAQAAATTAVATTADMAAVAEAQLAASETLAATAAGANAAAQTTLAASEGAAATGAAVEATALGAEAAAAEAATVATAGLSLATLGLVAAFAAIAVGIGAVIWSIVEYSKAANDALSRTSEMASHRMTAGDYMNAKIKQLRAQGKTVNVSQLKRDLWEKDPTFRRIRKQDLAEYDSKQTYKRGGRTEAEAAADSRHQAELKQKEADEAYKKKYGSSEADMAARGAAYQAAHPPKTPKGHKGRGDQDDAVTLTDSLVAQMAKAAKSDPSVKYTCANFASNVIAQFTHGLFDQGGHAVNLAGDIGTGPNRSKGIATYLLEHGGRYEGAAEARPGDLVVGPGKGPSKTHVGVYLGHGMYADSNNGRDFGKAKQVTGRNRFVSIPDQYLDKRYKRGDGTPDDPRIAQLTEEEKLAVKVAEGYGKVQEAIAAANDPHTKFAEMLGVSLREYRSLNPEIREQAEHLFQVKENADLAAKGMKEHADAMADIRTKWVQLTGSKEDQVAWARWQKRFAELSPDHQKDIRNEMRDAGAVDAEAAARRQAAGRIAPLAAAFLNRGQGPVHEKSEFERRIEQERQQFRMMGATNDLQRTKIELDGDEYKMWTTNQRQRLLDMVRLRSAWQSLLDFADKARQAESENRQRMWDGMVDYQRKNRDAMEEQLRVQNERAQQMAEDTANILVDSFRHNGLQVASFAEEVSQEWSKMLGDMILSWAKSGLAGALEGVFGHKSTPTNKGQQGQNVDLGSESSGLGGLFGALSSVAGLASAFSQSKTTKANNMDAANALNALAFGPLMGFATGGLPTVGSTFIAGERGPEAIRLGQTARVYNADDTDGMLGGQRINIVQNIRAVDTADFKRNRRKLAAGMFKDTARQARRNNSRG